MALSRILLAVAALLPCALSYSTPAAYGIGKPKFDEYRSKLPKDFDVVAAGGWYSLQKKYVAEVGKEKLSKTSLPTDLDIVRVGGYDNLSKLAADPKAELVTLIVKNLRDTKGSGDFAKDATKVEALIALLQSEGKGFSSVKVDGEWCPVFQKQGKKSPKTQKFIGKKEKYTSSFSNFDVKKMEFVNLVSTPRGNGLIKAVVKYTPVAKGFDKKDGKIVLRRIACDITKATFKYWKFPTISLPFLTRKKGGYLDFLYLDDDMRITKGNNGGLFVHFRPEFIKKVVG